LKSVEVAKRGPLLELSVPPEVRIMRLGPLLFGLANEILIELARDNPEVVMP
jgi:hypothetical protein